MVLISNFICAVVTILTFTTTFTNGQYETPNHICGGWFKSVTGSIQFKYNETTTDTEHVCAWTVSGSLASQYSRYDITIQQLNDYACDASTTRVAVSHFNLWAQDVTAVETWNCGGPQQWRAVPGTVFIIVWKTTLLKNMSGFQVNWAPNGDRLDHMGVRTTAYSWGKPSVDPLPYYASGFFTEEVATHVFPKGNNTKGYELEIEFQTLQLDQCGDEEIDSGPCFGKNNSTLLVCTIEEDGRLKLGARFHEEKLPDDAPVISSPWGLVILVWSGDFFRAGGRFQMVYRSVRI